MSGVSVGRVGKPHGVRGYVTIMPDTDDPTRFDTGSTFETSDGRVLTVAQSRRQGRLLLVRFDGVDSRNQAEELRGVVLSIETQERRTLGEGEYWPDELIGLAVRDPNDLMLGQVVDVVEGAAQDRLIIESVDRRRVDVPFVAALVPVVDIDGGFVVVRPIPGLLSSERD